MKYLGIDFGLKRVGLAVSEGEIASAWQVIKVKNFLQAVEKISQLVLDQQFNKIVIGMPEGKMGQNVAGFIKALKKRGIEVEAVDETLSSQKALTQMIELNLPKQKRQQTDDRAAAIILQDYLDRLKV